MKRKWLWILVVLLLASGCARRERTYVAPPLDLGEGSTVAVVYWENYTQDPGLSVQWEGNLGARLSPYYNVLDPFYVESELQRQGIRRGMPVTPSLAQEIGQLLGAEFIVAGEIQYYFEDVRQNAPKREELFPPGAGVVWKLTQNTQVVVAFVGRVFDGEDGQLLYSYAGEGTRSIADTLELDWKGEEPPHRALVPAAHRQNIPEARLGAVGNGVELFTEEILPSYRWQWAP